MFLLIRIYKLNKDKDVQYWKEQSNFHVLIRMSAQDMILYLEEYHILTKDSFSYLEPIIYLDTESLVSISLPKNDEKLLY